MEKIEEYLKQRLKDFKKENFLQQAYAFGLEYEQTRTGCSQCVVCAMEKILRLTLKVVMVKRFYHKKRYIC